jgi:hypothetical protein
MLTWKVSRAREQTGERDDADGQILQAKTMISHQKH